MASPSNPHHPGGPDMDRGRLFLCRHTPNPSSPSSPPASLPIHVRPCHRRELSSEKKLPQKTPPSPQEARQKAGSPIGECHVRELTPVIDGPTAESDHRGGRRTVHSCPPPPRATPTSSGPLSFRARAHLGPVFPSAISSSTADTRSAVLRSARCSPWPSSVTFLSERTIPPSVTF